MTKLALIHTAYATIPSLNTLIRDQFKHVEIMNWLDDSIIPMLMKHPNKFDYPFDKLLAYAEFAERQGADYIINACSSVGAFKDYAKRRLMTPIIRIDDPVTDVLAEFEQVAVLGTLHTTLKPSTELLQSKSENLSVEPVFVKDAFKLGSQGYKDTHDELIAKEVERALEGNQAVYLAQASMADAVGLIDSSSQQRVYTSPEYLIKHLHTLMICSP